MSLAVDVVLRPIRTGNTFEETVERLHAIKLGVFTEGERMPPERDLAARLGGRATLRDAIRVLEQFGYIESPGADGRHVRDVPGDASASAPDGAEEIVRSLRQRGSDLDDALTLRAVLEVGAVEAAARRELSDGERPPHRPAGRLRVRRPRRLPADGLAAAPGDRRGHRLALARRGGGRRAHAGQRPARPDPLAHPEHRALQRPAPGHRRGHRGRRRRRRPGRGAGAPRRHRRPPHAFLA